MKTTQFKPLYGPRALVSALCIVFVLAGSWLAGCSGGSSGSGLSLGSGLPTGGGGGGPDGGNGTGGNGTGGGGTGGGGTGGGGGGTTATPTPVPGCGVGTLNATFTTATAANADTSAFSATKVQGSASGAGASDSSFTLVGTLCRPPLAGNRTVTIRVNQPLVAGTNYTLSGGSAGNNFLQYIESSQSDDQTIEKSWTATTATLTVQSVTSQTVTFRIQNASLSPDPDFFTSNASGTFNLSVTGTITLINGL